MKTKIFLTWILGIALIAGCAEGDKFDFNKKVIYVTGADVDPLIKFVVENTPVAYTVTASATDKVTEKTVVTFAHDAALVAAYNEANTTNYYPIPASAIEIDGTQGVIEAGQAASSGITVRVVDTRDFKDGQIYMIPITIKSVQGGGDMEVLAPSKTIYLRISRTVGFPSWNISNSSGNVNSNFIFEDNQAIPMTNGFTYEIKCYVDQWHQSSNPGYQISRLCAFTSKDESNGNMLRFGEDGNDINALQWCSPVGNFFANTKFNLQQWYLISLTYDGSKFTLYVDGIKDMEFAGTADCTFQRMEIGMSWASTYRTRQRFLGRIAEIRVWNRPLSTGELQMGVCGVDPASASGLKAYWKLNEGSGYIFRDATNNGYDMDWSNTWRAPGENDIQQINLSQYVVWAEDDKNKCNL